MAASKQTKKKVASTRVSSSTTAKSQAQATSKKKSPSSAAQSSGVKSSGVKSSGAKSSLGKSTASTAKATKKAAAKKMAKRATKAKPAGKAEADPVEAPAAALPAGANAAEPLTEEEQERLDAEREEAEARALEERGETDDPTDGVGLDEREIESQEEGSELDDMSTDELWVEYRKEFDILVDAIDPDAAVRPTKKSLTSPRLEDLRNQLIERHYPLVRYIAERLLQTLPRSIELDDLCSAGQFGLMDAIRGFDPERGIKFKTYCSTRIRGSILDQLRSQDWVPRLVRLKASRIEKALQRLTGEYGREPTHAELARSLEMDATELSKEMGEAQAKAMFSLSEKWDDEDEGSVEKVEILEDRDAPDPVNELNRRDLMKFITRSLTHKERFIIDQYYQYGHTMREIGEMLGLTESRVCQIHTNVMGRLNSLLDKRSDGLNEQT
jgi:RNA polymerase sigma factor for flagellar operon FliA